MMTVLNLDPITNLTREQFYRLCEANSETPLERSPKGELIIVAPVGGEGGNQEASLIAKVVNWNEQTGLGVVFSSSTIFSLPGGGDRSPDVAWVQLERWQALSQFEREGFPPICPDFVIELRSRTDRLKPLPDKMQEYLSFDTPRSLIDGDSPVFLPYLLDFRLSDELYSATSNNVN